MWGMSLERFVCEECGVTIVGPAPIEGVPRSSVGSGAWHRDRGMVAHAVDGDGRHHAIIATGNDGYSEASEALRAGMERR